MSDLKKKSSCQVGCWAMAAARGLADVCNAFRRSAITAFITGHLVWALWCLVLLGLVFSSIGCSAHRLCLQPAREITAA